MSEDKKKAILARKRLIKALALSVGLSGSGVANAGEVKGEDAFEAKVEASYSPESNEVESSVDFMEAREALEAEQAYKGDEPWNYASADHYAAAHGLYKSVRLSNGLNRFGNGIDFQGYAGAYINKNARGTSNEVVFLPNNLQEDYGAIRTCRKVDAINWQRGSREMYNHNSHSINGYCPDAKIDVNRRIKGARISKKAKRVIRTVDGVLRTIDMISNRR